MDAYLRHPKAPLERPHAGPSGRGIALRLRNSSPVGGIASITYRALASGIVQVPLGTRCASHFAAKIPVSLSHLSHHRAVTGQARWFARPEEGGGSAAPTAQGAPPAGIYTADALASSQGRGGYRSRAPSVVAAKPRLPDRGLLGFRQIRQNVIVVAHALAAALLRQPTPHWPCAYRWPAGIPRRRRCRA